jgi:hypothetical protein
MEIPNSFQLMGHRWTVQRMPGSFEEDGDLCNGICDFQTLTIRVNTDAADSLVMHSFMHEVMHAVLWTLGHELATNEGFVDATGAALAQVLESAE